MTLITKEYMFTIFLPNVTNTNNVPKGTKTYHPGGLGYEVMKGEIGKRNRKRRDGSGFHRYRVTPQDVFKGELIDPEKRNQGISQFHYRLGTVPISLSTSPEKPTESLVRSGYAEGVSFPEQVRLVRDRKSRTTTTEGVDE